MEPFRIIALIILWITTVYQLLMLGLYPLSLNQRIPVMIIVLLVIFLLHTVFKSED